MGTSQALYYREIEDGLEDEKGRIFYKTSRLSAANEPAISTTALDKAWTQACYVYQRRADLVPNVLNTVGSAQNFDNSLLDAVREARRAVGNAALDPDRAPTDRTQMERFELSQQQLGRALSQLLVAASRSPDLKNNENLSTLQAQLEGTENRVSVERANFNKVAQTFNATLPPGSEGRPVFSHPTY